MTLPLRDLDGVRLMSSMSPIAVHRFALRSPSAFSSKLGTSGLDFFAIWIFGFASVGKR
jgi:hypothetical protein